MFKNCLHLKLDPKWSPEEEFEIFSGLFRNNDFKQQSKLILLALATFVVLPVIWQFF